MSIEVNSPFNNRPVKIRPQDLGKAVRDSDGKLFYVLPRSDGTGYYGAPTRSGGQRDEQRATHNERRLAEAKKVHAERSAHEVKTERTKSRATRWLALLILLAGAAATALYWFFFRVPQS